MADLSYTVDVNTTSAQRNLDSLNSKVDKVNKTFASFKSVIAGLAIGSFISQTFQFADAMQDLSDATNIGTDAILGFGSAVAQSGGTADKAQLGLLKFVETIGEAADGGLKAQQALKTVGITLQDLRTLSEEQLLDKAINGLANIEGAGARSAAQLDLFGKALRGVSAQGVAGLFAGATASSTQYAASIKSAAQAQQNFETVIKTLQIEVLRALKPISDIAAGLLDMGKATKSFISAVFDIAVVVGTFFAIGKAIQLLITAFKYLALGPVLVKQGFDALKRTFDILVYQFGKIAKEGKITDKTLEGISKRFHWLGVGINEIVKGMGILAGAFVAFYKVAVPEGAQQKISGLFDKLKEMLGFKSDGKVTEDMKKQEAAAANAKDALEKRRKEIEESAGAFRKQNNEMIDQLNIEKMLVGKSQEYSEVIRAQEEIFKRGADEVDKLRVAKSLLGDKEQELAPIYDEQIAKVQAQINVDAERIKNSIEGLQGLKLLEQDRLNNIQRMTDALEKQKQLDASILQIRQQTQGQLDDTSFQKQQMGRNPLEQQFASIQESARKAALEAGRAFAEQFNLEDMGAADAKKLADGLALIADRYRAIAEAQTANLEASRSWEQGWKTAFDSYMDNATNAATKAGEAFSSITSNMNSAIDNFVESGKFKFSDLARSIIQDLIKIELKSQATKLLSGASSFLGSLFGGFFAEGGQPPIGKPSIVGENGPELFVPKTAGTIVPNGGGNGGNQPGGNTYITNNISAIDAKSVAQLFAENRRTLFGSVQLAQKELSYGR
jgi:lambda family phage tail tape measure protein